MPAPHASVWWATLPSPPAQRPSLDRDVDADVAIVGAGFTGLWLARALRVADPTLRVVVLESSVAGAGASGRNGGWASALYPVSFDAIAATHGVDTMRRLRATLRASVDALGLAARDEGIDCDFDKGGTVTLARSAPQASRLLGSLAGDRDLGDTDDDITWLDAATAAVRCGATGLHGALYTPHCATVHPAKLVTGLADAAARHGAVIYEHSPVVSIVPATRATRACAITPHGTVRADVVVRATEAFTPSIRGHRREVAPIYSLVISTGQLAASFFERAGPMRGTTFTDGRHLLVYGQRTADDRIVFGGRGAPYHFASRVSARYDTEPRVFARLEAALRDLFGPIPASITHRWGGAVAVARDSSPSVRYDQATGMASAGGYLGDGVTMSFLAASTLCDLIVGASTDRTLLPYVQHRSPRWAPEPVRWISINAAIGASRIADRRESATGRESAASKLLDRLARR